MLCERRERGISKKRNGGITGGTSVTAVIRFAICINLCKPGDRLRYSLVSVDANGECRECRDGGLCNGCSGLPWGDDRRFDHRPDWRPQSFRDCGYLEHGDRVAPGHRFVPRLFLTLASHCVPDHWRFL